MQCGLDTQNKAYLFESFVLTEIVLAGHYGELGDVLQHAAVCRRYDRAFVVDRSAAIVSREKISHLEGHDEGDAVGLGLHAADDAADVRIGRGHPKRESEVLYT